MAKSLRSKWKRKMRAEKRVRYGEKELQRLKDMLTKAGDYQMLPENGETQKMEDSSEIIPINAIPKTRITKKARRTRGDRSSASRKSRRDEHHDEEEEEDGDEVEMKSDDDDEKEEAGMSVDKQERVFSKRTMKDQFGNYPVWMNKRKIMTQKKKNKRIAKNRAKSLSGKRK